FLSCHLSGTGHLVRIVRLAQAALARGHSVSVISGGRPLAHHDAGAVPIVQLPPLAVADLDFGVLRQPSGAPADDAYMHSRLDMIAAVLAAPVDALVTELFPLGRRALSGEFLAAIDAARRANPGVRVIASVRDIPEPKPKRVEEAARRLSDHYDGVLVHGDADLVPLWSTWPLPDDVRAMVRHTSYIAPALPPASAQRGETVLVSSGGGTLGGTLLPVAAEAASRSARPWHILVGGPDAAARARTLADLHPHPSLTIEAARADYQDLLGRAACSVSLAGYNTVVELAGLTVPCLLVPSEEGGEQEQLLRAQALTGHQGVEMLRAADLTPALLSARAEALASGPARPPVPLNADDGTDAVRAIEEILSA
ncbi:MAG: glycosyltransferase, partial [Pseudomonadota bacterium]